MLKLLNFHSCVGHNGDIHFSREFIKHVMRSVQAERYTYTHGNSRRCILDIPKLEHVRKGQHCDPHTLWHLNGNKLHVNAWAGCRGGRYLSAWERKQPFEGAFILANHSMWSDLIAELRGINIHIKPLRGIKYYIPKINYSYYQTTNTDKFVDEHPNIKVLVCNGPCHSAQTVNFSFDPFIQELVHNKKLCVITTKKTPIQGAHFTGDINKIQGCDLNEISYLSKFCNIIIGRGSGPFCYCENQDNHNLINKRFIGIARSKTWAFWWNNSKIMRWTPHFHTNHLINTFYRTLGEIRNIKLL